MSFNNSVVIHTSISANSKINKFLLSLLFQVSVNFLKINSKYIVIKLVNTELFFSNVKIITLPFNLMSYQNVFNRENCTVKNCQGFVIKLKCYCSRKHYLESSK